MANLFERLTPQAKEAYDNSTVEPLKELVKEHLENLEYHVDLTYITISAMEDLGMIEDNKIYNIWKCFK